MSQNKEIKQSWDYATFKGARRFQAKSGASQLSAYDRIQWVCEMSEQVQKYKKRVTPKQK